ncbi:unnamed protein product [Allacma fusca]|uniref:Uncharacterized protein n=1 Tax=Allacma fusca TaxID=39272 RepID=A0A8J2PWA9_9HEXA|nr:unnamed protein product [Allacma fusca]
MNRFNSAQLSSLSDGDSDQVTDISDSDGDVTEDEDSDREPAEDDDDESDGKSTQDLIDQVEASFLDLLVHTVEQVQKNHDTNIQIRIEPPKILTTQSRDEETQTDANHGSSDQASENASPANDSEEIRNEIASLRVARDSLVNQRKEVADRMKRNNMNGDHRAEDEKKLYEFEEAIEAIDSVIEFKNEAICGRECILSNCVAPGRNEADLVTRLTNLTTLDLQRLLVKYFSKVVEIRYSSKRLEKQIEELESNCENMGLMLTRNQKQIKEMNLQYEARIKLIIGLYNKNASTALDEYVHILDKKLSAAYKRQHDLQTALTELLVRHRYLTNGTDYDVKHVVKMLGIDTAQTGLNWRPEDKPKKKADQMGEISSNRRHALESGLDSQGISRRMREVYEHRQTSHRSHHHPSQHHHQRDVNGLDMQESHHVPVQEVRRKGRQKLYIQPRSSSPHPP